MIKSISKAACILAIAIVAGCGDSNSEGQPPRGDSSVGGETGTKSSASGNQAPAEDPSSSNGIKNCYLHTSNKDTIVLSFVVNDSSVKGDLIYKFHEKDRNTGTVDGILKGDTLIADYTFKSEGTSSIRQVVFLRKGNELVEGFGDVEDNNGRMIFRNLSTLSFERNMVLKQTDCAALPPIAAR